MPCTELSEWHFDVLSQLHADRWTDVFNMGAVIPLEQMAALRMVEWDVSERPIRATPDGGVFGWGRAKLLPDGASALADWQELGLPVVRNP